MTAWGKALVAAILAVSFAAGPACAEPVVIVALGDSLTQGYGLPPEDGFVPQLQAWLDARGSTARIVNAGVSGDTTAGGLARLDWTLTADVGALILALGGNDVLRGLAPAQSRANLEAIVARATGRGLPVLLIGITAPANYGPEYKAEFEAIFPDLAARHGTLLEPSFLGALEAMEDRAAARARYLQGDGIHPNAAGVALIVEALGPAVEALAARAAPAR